MIPTIDNCIICNGGTTSCNQCNPNNTNAFLSSLFKTCLNDCKTEPTTYENFININNKKCIFCEDTIGNCSKCLNSTYCIQVQTL